MSISKFTAKALAVMAVVSVVTLILGLGTIFTLMVALALKYLWIALLA